MHLQSWKKDSQELQRTGLKQRGTSGWDLVSAVLLMIFYRPVLTLQHRQRRNVRHIFIRFSAWEYAGSDQLWAGLITALCDGIEGHFGLVPVSVYRAVGRKCGLVEAPLRKEWVSKRYLCLPLWAAVLLVGGAGVGVAILVLLFGVPIGNASGDAIAVAEGLGATAVGITAAAALRMGAMVVRNVVITQKAQLERQMNRTDLSAQLGFMSNVKREVQTITSFLQFMEIFQRRKLRVVLEVTSLDHCSPDRVVGVLDAMNILLSDNEAPFISILVADPSIIVGCVESSLYMKGMANNGYEFLNRIVTLPFSVPKTDSDTKLQLMRSIVTYREEQEKSLEEEEGLGVDAEPPKRCGKGFKAKDLIQEAFEFLLDENTKLYLTDNVVQMKRVINTISVMIRLMATQVPREKLCPQKVASWVLLASQWPCRLSWILQCIEDDEQMGRLGVCQGGQLGPDLLLWDVYEKNLEEFVMFASQLEKLLELDGDPELFHSFLSGRFQVKDARFFVLYTVNMDSSLKRHMELLRGSHGLKSSKRAPGLSRCLLRAPKKAEGRSKPLPLQRKEEHIQGLPRDRSLRSPCSGPLVRPLGAASPAYPEPQRSNRRLTVSWQTVAARKAIFSPTPL
uniref:KAP NTPase domain-containing protein n=1 Tax=Varanus komodoensis TaxID=61221 RepID=A0A8D2IP45_VARKO